VVTPWQTTADAGYQAMLGIIQQGREEALRKPRVDMPGAQVISGKHRELAPPMPDTVMSVSRNRPSE
jgi:hypothetical protein